MLIIEGKWEEQNERHTQRLYTTAKPSTLFRQEQDKKKQGKKNEAEGSTADWYRMVPSTSVSLMGFQVIKPIEICPL